MDRLVVPFVIHWHGEPEPDLSRFVEPVRVPFRFVPKVDRRHTHQQALEAIEEGVAAAQADQPLSLVSSFTRDVNNTTARALRMTRKQLSRALHMIKDATGLGGADNVIIYLPSGDVYDGDELIGNLRDE